MYEVDGKHPDVSVNKFKLSHDVTVFISKLVTIHQKKIEVKVKDKGVKLLYNQRVVLKKRRVIAFGNFSFKFPVC